MWLLKINTEKEVVMGALVKVKVKVLFCFVLIAVKIVKGMDK